MRLGGAVTQQQQQRRAPTISPAEAQLALWSAAKDGDFAGAKKAVESGADVNAVNFRDGGATALHYAARTGRVAYVFVCLVSCYLLARALPPPPLTLVLSSRSLVRYLGAQPGIIVDALDARGQTAADLAPTFTLRRALLNLEAFS